MAMQNGEKSRHTIPRPEVNDMEPPEIDSGTTQRLPPIPLRNVRDDPRWWAILNRRKKSDPYDQFEVQREQERERLIEQRGQRQRGRRSMLPEFSNMTMEENAYSNVRSRWKEQGIWDGDWGYEPFHLWKHEMEPEPKIEDGRQPDSHVLRFGSRPRIMPESMTDEQRATHERETIASRPYHQFVYQLAREREWIAEDIPFDQLRPDTIAAAARLHLDGKPLEAMLYQSVDPSQLTGDKRTDDEIYFDHNVYESVMARWIKHGGLDLDEMAYKAVKARWIKQEIWDREWGEMPGMEWHMCSAEDEYSALVSTQGNPQNGPRPDSFDLAKPHGPVHDPSSFQIRDRVVWGNQYKAKDLTSTSTKRPFSRSSQLSPRT